MYVFTGSKSYSVAAEKRATAADSTNKSNSNRNVNSNNDDDDDNDDRPRRRRFLSAWGEVWTDLEAVLRAATDLSNTALPRPDDQLIRFPDKRVEALAQSLVGDVYLSISKCQNDPDYIEHHRTRLVTSLMSALYLQPHANDCTVCIRRFSG